MPEHLPDAKPSRLSVLYFQLELRLTGKEPAMKCAQLDDTKTQRGGWQKQAEGSQRLLADQRSTRREWFGRGKTVQKSLSKAKT